VRGLPFFFLSQKENIMDKQKIAQRLAEIKTITDALKAEEATLRSQLSVGDKLKGAWGEVHLTERTTTTYNEGLYQDLLTLGVDPLLLGKVRLTPDAEKVASVTATTPAVQVALTKHATTKTSTVLRVKPDATVEVEGRAKVASLLG
jgi:hypothetical protein